MNIKIDRKTFADALAEVAPFAPQKAPIAVLKNAKITTKGRRMKIEANDTQCSMVKYIDTLECDTDGSFLADIADLNKFVSKTRGESLDISIDGSTMHIKHSKGSASFQTVDADEFPVFRMPDDDMVIVTIPASALVQAIQNGKDFVHDDKIGRPYMCAIYAYIENGTEFGYCSTDTAMLIHGKTTVQMPPETNVHWLIMPPVFSALQKACKGNDTVSVHITPGHVMYDVGSVRIHTVQAKGNYPNFKRIIPTAWGMECAVDKSEMIDAITRLLVFCDESECVKMEVSRMDMTLSTDNYGDGKSSKENITHNGCDGELLIGVNASKFLRCVRAFENGELLMRMSEPSRPILFGSTADPNLMAIVMPLQVTN